MLRGELFSTDMVRAYQEGRKLHTVRPVKPQPSEALQYPYGFITGSTDRREVGKFCWTHEEICDGRVHTVMPKHRPGDYIYCRETWGTYTEDWQDSDRFLYKADYPDGANGYWHEPEQISWCDLPKWRPSIHMPREAARLFFRVSKVEVMRLEDVTEEFAREDGFQAGATRITGGPWGVEDDPDEWTALEQFREFWRSTYGDARWMWVYWTEPCTREEAE